MCFTCSRLRMTLRQWNPFSWTDGNVLGLNTTADMLAGLHQGPHGAVSLLALPGAGPGWTRSGDRKASRRPRPRRQAGSGSPQAPQARHRVPARRWRARLLESSRRDVPGNVSSTVLAAQDVEL